MKRIVLLTVLLVGFVIGFSSTAPASTWTELGDAEMLPGSAQEVIGVGPLDSISGSFVENDVVDMYKIYIENSNVFYADVIQTAGPSPWSHQLFLFDSNGVGIFGNDNTTGGAYLPSFSSLGPGVYYLATSQYNIDPGSIEGAIFPGTGGQLVWAVNNSPVVGWGGTYSPRQASYKVRLSGVEFIAPVPENQPPVADAGSDQTFECADATGTLVTLDGSGSTDPDSTEGTNDDIVSFDWFENGIFIGSGETLDHTFPLGLHTVTLVVTDSFGETASDEVVITVEDTTPPEISVSVSPDTLWPPNHKMVLCTPTVIVSDNCDPSSTFWLELVTSDESEEAYTYDPAFDMYTGEGHTDDDIQIVDGDIYLRAERSAHGVGRIYTITYEAADASGNTASASATVTVPHNQ